jgi:hypothetical protein
VSCLFKLIPHLQFVDILDGAVQRGGGVLGGGGQGGPEGTMFSADRGQRLVSGGKLGGGLRGSLGK